MTPKEAVEFCKKKGARVVDLRFVDIFGKWHHFSIPVAELSEAVFEDGFGFDGSSLRAWQPIHMSDLLAMPDPGSAVMDPFLATPTLAFTCDIVEPITRENYSKDPRNIARKAETYLKSTGIADTAYFGPEPEFFIFDSIRYSHQPNHSFYFIESSEGPWTTGENEEPNLGYKIGLMEGYQPLPPSDSLQDIRSEMMLTMEKCGIAVERQHHEVATGGQAEINFKFSTLVRAADMVQQFKYIVKNTARKHGKTVTFMPKPILGDNGSGMHTHVSLWKGGEPLFAGDGYAGLSDLAMYAIGGILHHASALLAFTNPTTNSYKRLAPGHEAPINLAYSSRNRSAAIRIPMYSHNPKATRIEFRTPDPSCNAYLAFAAITMAVIDGIQNKLDPGKPLDKDIYDLPPEELAKVPATPESLARSIDALEENHEFLLKGDVFTQDVIETWVSYKRTHELEPIKLRPHPYEFSLYYDV
ncbi:MAG: type I glutamate--ammonia ligase [Candidatus Brocadiales bacterium]|nr:type I glutamate--ammonia ligase [Candidatus Bathyanammoxibius amoris]